MKKDIIRYIIFISILTLITLAVSYWDDTLIYTHVVYLFIFLITITVLTEWILKKTLATNPNQLFIYYLIMMLARLFLSVGIAFIIIYYDWDQRIIFIVNFFVLYLCFLSFEIYSIMSNLRAHSNKDQVDLN